MTAPSQSDGSKAGKAIAALIVTEVARVGQWMGGGSMVVQAIGLFQAGPQLMAALKGPDGDKLREAALSAADGLSGFAGALADTSASTHKAMLLENSAGRQMVALSTRLVVLETAAAVAGMAGGALNAVMMGYKAGEAWRQGDRTSATAYAFGATVFTGTFFTSATTAANTAAGGAVARAIARRILLSGVAIVSAEMLAQSAVAVAAGIATAGWVLLVVGIGAAIYGSLMARTELQRWAARCWFGNGGAAGHPRYSTADDEEAALDGVLPPSSPLDATHVLA